jgi:Chlorophyll A-B binding protein
MRNIVSLLFLFCFTANSFNFYGATKPLGYFDPLGFAKSKPESELVKLREAELKHGRWGMISAVAIPVTELVTHQQGIHVLDNANAITVSAFVSAVAASELQSMSLGWENPFKKSSNSFLMKTDYQPGSLGFSLPLSFLGKDETFMLEAEINHGRLAMIGSLGMIAQELVSNKPIF